MTTSKIKIRRINSNGRNDSQRPAKTLKKINENLEKPKKCQA